jgi:hypothetical protein
VIVLLLGVARPAAAEEAISEEAKLYFRNGVELIQSSPPNYQDAYYQFKLAYEKSKSWKVLGNLGLCSFKLERDGEALDAYNQYLKSGGNDIDPEERKQLERDVLLITGNSAAVSLTSSVADVEVIDARAGTSVPPQTYKFQGTGLALRLRAGTHTLTATTPDGKQERWEVNLSPGKTVEHAFSFGATATPVAAAPVAAAPAGEPTPDPVDKGESGGSGLRTVGFVTAGVGAAALVGGVVTGLMAKGKESDATDQCTADKVCPTSAEADFDSASSMATVSTVLYIGGGVLAAAGVGMIVFGGGGKESAPAAARGPRLELSPYVGATGAGVFARGSF